MRDDAVRIAFERAAQRLEALRECGLARGKRIDVFHERQTIGDHGNRRGDALRLREHGLLAGVVQSRRERHVEAAQHRVRLARLCEQHRGALLECDALGEPRTVFVKFQTEIGRTRNHGNQRQLRERRETAAVGARTQDQNEE